MAAEYHFVTNWMIQGTAREVAEVLGDPLGLARWWPSVYLDVREVEPGDPVTHIGRVIDLHTKGWLPEHAEPDGTGVANLIPIS